MSSIPNPLSFYGRLGPKLYWIIVGLILLFRIVAVAVALARPEFIFLTKTDFLIGIIALVMGKRMKDFGVSAVWAWGLVALIAFILPIGIVFLLHATQGAPADIPSWLGILVFGLLLVLVLGVGLRKGDPGPNRYGEPPTPAPAPGA